MMHPLPFPDQRGRRHTTLLLLAMSLAQAVPARADTPNWPKTFAVITFERYTEHTCHAWKAQGVATAQPFSADEMASWDLARYDRFNAAPASAADVSHLHTFPDGTTALSPSFRWYFDTREPWQRAREINKEMFGTEDPPVGTRVSVKDEHEGGCAADHGIQECWGVVVMQSRNDYAFLPPGACTPLPSPERDVSAQEPVPVP